ncbi:ATP-dependent DNA helicase UvrD/PcrA [Chlamydia suis]|uniref:DNA 3'-5' helicase n=2 Tax=Chlamydia suis TaxID=83559 RepID=A0ABX6IV78_9CHLA|nr:ATP-dependent DNA helicase UvrD/PcrA [Chlamydia suis]
MHSRKFSSNPKNIYYVRMLTSELNAAQVAAVTAPLQPVLVLAGAGAGKTRVVSHRILYLIEEAQLDPKQILAITFTNKAANELKERVQTQCLSLKHKGMPMVSTFHSLGVYILRHSIQFLDRQQNFAIYDQGDSEKLIKQCLRKLNLDKKLCNAMQFRISQAKNRLQNPEDLDSSEFPDPTRAVYEEYQEQLRAANALDFDDLLFLTERLLRLPEIQQEYANHWKALLIDEYQDTNHAQYLIAKHLAASHNNIFVVGDPDQSIYSWRGANISNILNFEQDYPKALVVRLEENYRSCGTILEAANALIQNNSARLDKTLRSVKGPGDKIFCFTGKNDRDEAEQVLTEISNLHAYQDIPLSHICILYRTNFQSQSFEAALLKRGYPYEIIGGISFYKRQEIQDILAFLRLFSNNYDMAAFERTIGLKKCGIGATTLAALMHYAKTVDLPILQACWDVLEKKNIRLTKKQQQGLFSYLTYFHQMEQLYGNCELHEFIKETIRITDYLSTLKEDPETYEDRKNNLEQLLAETQIWGKSSENLPNFLEDLALKSSADETASSNDCLKLMTIHNSKGLEFPVVFLVGLEENLLPHANSMHENIEEERRLCYVGITRAQEYLYLSRAKTRFLWGTERTMVPSRFISELPRALLKFV